MHDQLKLLEDLQSVDVDLQETEKDLIALPRKLKDIKADVERVAGILEGERGRLSEAESYKAELEGEVKAEQDLLTKTKGKLASVRNSKEYLAIQREFEANRKSTSEREEEVSKLEEAIKQFQQSIATHEGELKTLKKHVSQEEVETTAKLAELNSRAESKRSRRDEMAQKVRRDVLRKYDALIKRRGGKAVVPAKGGVCTGCHMQLPPQLYNIIQRGTTIEQCPNCQRIIYYPEDEAAQAEA